MVVWQDGEIKAEKRKYREERVETPREGERKKFLKSIVSCHQAARRASYPANGLLARVCRPSIKLKGRRTAHNSRLVRWLGVCQQYGWCHPQSGSNLSPAQKSKVSFTSFHAANEGAVKPACIRESRLRQVHGGSAVAHAITHTLQKFLVLVTVEVKSGGR